MGGVGADALGDCGNGADAFFHKGIRRELELEGLVGDREGEILHIALDGRCAGHINWQQRVK